MFIIRRFIFRMLFAPFWLIVLLIIAVVVVAMMALAFSFLGFLFFAVVFGLGYWVRHDPVIGRNALEALAFSIGSFALMVAFQGMIWDGISAVWTWNGSSNDEDSDETPSLRIEP